MPDDVEIGPITDPDSIKNYAASLALRYQAARWEWLDRGVPGEAWIATEISKLSESPEYCFMHPHGVSCGGLRVAKVNGQKTLFASARLMKYEVLNTK